MSFSLGFLSVRQHAEHGYFGGYLITNQIARPLEFHCTMPVKPSRAQELLYGATIDAFICGEQIAKALVTKAKVKPQLVLADSSATLALACVSEIPTAHLHFEEEHPSPSLHLPTGRAGELLDFTVGPWQLSLLASHRQWQALFSQSLSELESRFDLTEPFGRVSEALLEAHPIAKAA